MEAASADFYASEMVSLNLQDITYLISLLEPPWICISAHTNVSAETFQALGSISTVYKTQEIWIISMQPQMV